MRMLQLPGPLLVQANSHTCSMGVPYLPTYRSLSGHSMCQSFFDKLKPFQKVAGLTYCQSSVIAGALYPSGVV